MELTLAEAADRLGIAASTLRHQVKNGRLSARLAGKTWLVQPEEIERYRTQSRGRRGRPPSVGPRPDIPSDPRSLDRAVLTSVALRYGIRSLRLFGSFARGDAGPDSDVDLIVEFEPGAEVGLLEHAQLADELTQLMRRRVDLVTRNSLRPRFRQAVGREAITIFAR